MEAPLSQQSPHAGSPTNFYFEHGTCSFDDITYSARALAEAATPNTPITVPIYKFIPQFHEPIWHELTRNDLKPITVINAIMSCRLNGSYKMHIDRIRCADNKYPIIIDEQYNILDGYHRAAKLYTETAVEAKCFMLSAEQLSSIANK